MDILFSILSFSIMIIIVVGFHEFGHYITARVLGIKVLKFTIGMGKDLISYTSKKTGIEYTFAMLPVGGYVKMLDESEINDKDRKNWTEKDLNSAFNRAPLWKRFFVVFNGPLFNFILALIILFSINLNGTVQVKPIIGNVQESSWSDNAGLKKGDQILSMDEEVTDTWYNFTMSMVQSIGHDFIEIKVLRDNQTLTLAPDISQFNVSRNQKNIVKSLGITPAHENYTNHVGSIFDKGTASKAGIKVGDIVLSIDNKEINNFSDIQKVVSSSPEQSISVKIERDGSILYKNVKTSSSLIDGKNIGLIGIGPKPIDYQENWFIKNNPSFSESISKSIDDTIYITSITFNMLKKFFTGDISPKNISGPVTMADAAGKSASNGIVSFFMFCAIISINLMIINLLPIPGLDGGHLAFYLYAFVARREIKQKYQEVALRIGILLVVSLMLFAISMDISDFFV